MQPYPENRLGHAFSVKASDTTVFDTLQAPQNRNWSSDDHSEADFCGLFSDGLRLVYEIQADVLGTDNSTDGHQIRIDLILPDGTLWKAYERRNVNIGRGYGAKPEEMHRFYSCYHPKTISAYRPVRPGFKDERIIEPPLRHKLPRPMKALGIRVRMLKAHGWYWAQNVRSRGTTCDEKPPFDKIRELVSLYRGKYPREWHPSHR